MKHILLPVVVCGLLSTGTALAQSKPAEEKKEIIIEKKEGGKKEKMVIVIDGNNVTIDGKPAKDFEGKEMIIIDKGSVIIDDRVIVPGHGKGIIEFNDFGRGSRPLLGVMTEKTENGAKIESVTEGSGAQKAGLKAGDIITQVNKEAIASPEDLVAAIGKNKPGDMVDVEYLRDGKKQKAKATLGKAEESFAWSGDPDAFNYRFTMPRAPRAPRPPMIDTEAFRNLVIYSGDQPKYGMSIQDDEDNRGVKVTEVEEESNAAKGGLKEDDIITEIDGEKVQSVDTMREMLSGKKDKTSISLKVLRGGKTENLTIRVPRKLKSADL